MSGGPVTYLQPPAQPGSALAACEAIRLAATACTHPDPCHCCDHGIALACRAAEAQP